MTPPLVSILMNSRNQPEYLAQQVRTLLRQTYTHFELIVCEASDDDAGATILEAFADRRIRIVRDLDRRGWAHGINMAAAAASGELVMFCADDDLFHPSMLERTVAALHASGAGTAVVPARGIDARGVPLGRAIVVPPHVRAEPTWTRLFERNWIIVALSRRDVLPRPMLNESLPGVGADWDLWLTLAWQRSGFTYHDELLFDYRVHSHSLVATRADTRADVRRVLERFTLDEIRGLYARRLFPDDVIEEAIASIAIAKGDYARALPYWQHRAAAGDVAGAAQAGALLVALGDDDAAQPLLRRVARPGEWPEAWNNLGVALARRGQHSEAQACFAEALRQLPLYRDARLNLEAPSPSLITERLLRPLDQILR